MEITLNGMQAGEGQAVRTSKYCDFVGVERKCGVEAMAGSVKRRV